MMGLLSTVCKFLNIPLSKTVEARITLIVSLILIFSDFISDAISLSVYWRLEHGRTLAILASVSLGLGAIVLVIQLCYIISLLRKRELDEEHEANLSLFKYFEIIFESVPQLWISLYVLSSCEQHDVVLYISAAISFLSILYGTVNVFKHAIDRDQKPTLLGYIFLYTLQAPILLARILLLVYMSYNVKWWTVLFIGLHFLVIFVVVIVMDVHDSDGSTDVSRIVKSLGLEIIVGVLFIFTCVSVDIIWADLVIFGTFVIGNAVGLGISYISSSEYCLYPNVIAVHVSLNVASIIVFVAYHRVKLWKRVKLLKQRCLSTNSSSSSLPQHNEPKDASAPETEVNMPLLLQSAESKRDLATLHTSHSGNVLVQINTLPTVSEGESSKTTGNLSPTETEAKTKQEEEGKLSETADNLSPTETESETKQEEEDESYETTDNLFLIETETETKHAEKSKLSETADNLSPIDTEAETEREKEVKSSEATDNLSPSEKEAKTKQEGEGESSKTADNLLPAETETKTKQEEEGESSETTDNLSPIETEAETKQEKEGESCKTANHSQPTESNTAKAVNHSQHGKANNSRDETKHEESE